MNFIGHATVALWTSRVPAFVLGAMLPDLVNMAGLRLPRELPRGPLAEGVSHHHQTDALFHAEPSFLVWTQYTLDRLSQLGVARGPARAVAHVGAEMLLDGELLGRPEVVDAYEAALGELARVRSLFTEPEQRTRWAQLEGRLRAHGTPYDYRNTDAVLERLIRVFQGRKRLAIDAPSERIVRSVLPDLQRHVVVETPHLLASLRRQLENIGGPADGAVLV
ncbi:MAG: hypothetical protein QM778_01140 [Myxococcales bacterium]